MNAIEVGTTVMARVEQYDDDEHGNPRTTEVGTYGRVGAIYPDQDNCYQIEFDNGAGVMLTPAEFSTDLEIVS